MLTQNIKNDLKSVIGPQVETGEPNYLSKLDGLIHKYKNVSRIQDSLSESKVQSISVLTEAIESHKLIDSASNVVIWGCGYGTILIPYFSPRVAQVFGIDKDDEVIAFSKNKLFSVLENVDLITDDIFATHRDFYLKTNLIVNTACDYMRPMSEWPWFKHGALANDPEYYKGAGDKDPNKKRAFKSPKLAAGCHFAFQSSDLIGRGGRTNCVRSLEEFRAQLPHRAEVLFEKETTIDDGKLFTILGRFIENS